MGFKHRRSDRARKGANGTALTRKAGVWDRLMDAITKAYDGNVQMIDTSVVRVHQQGATGKRGVEIVVSVARAAGSPPKSMPSSMRKGARSSSS